MTTTLRRLAAALRQTWQCSWCGQRSAQPTTDGMCNNCRTRR
jgi:rubrerythrin